MAAKKYKWSDGKQHSIPETKHKSNVAAAKRRGATTSTVTTADRIRLGPTAAAVKAASSPKEWSSIVKAAHGRGYTVQSAVSDVPDELKARTQTSLRASAQKAIGEVYQPQEAELDYQTRLVEGTRQKRLADEQVFGNWLAQKTSEIAAQGAAAQAQYQGVIDKYTGDTQADAAASNARLQQRAQAGASGDVSGSIALQGAAERNQTRVEMARNQSNAAAALGPIRARDNQAIQLSALGESAKARGAVETDTAKARTEIFGNRLKMQSDKAAALAQRYADDLKTEMDKASANRDFETMQAQLEDKTAERAQAHAEFLTGQATTRQGQRIAAATTRAGQRTTAATSAANRRATADEKALDRAAKATTASLDRAAALQRARIAHPAGSGKAASETAKKASRGSVQAIHSLAGYISGQKKVKGHNSLFVNGAWRPTRQALKVMGATDDQINVALRYVSGARGARAVRNPQLLGILPEDVGLI